MGFICAGRFRMLPRELDGRMYYRLVGMVMLGGALFILQVDGAEAARHVGVSPTRCATRDSATVACRVMPASGAFTLPIPGTPAFLVGVGTPDRAGKPIVISRTSLVCPQLGGIGISIRTPRSSGLLPPLHWTNGTLYYRPASAQACTSVTSPALAAAPGVYQVVPTSGVTSMPKSGGGVDPGSSDLPAFVAGLLVLLLGTAMWVTSRTARW
jgi:hypothetical protein